jgi:hypothetical protein
MSCYYNDNELYDCEKSDEILLEPRLIEYIKKKKYFQENGIDVHNLERDFGISEMDMLRVRSYLRGDKKSNTKHEDLIDPTDADFPSAHLKKDTRFERMKVKQKRTKDAQTQRHNYGLINRGFDMFRDDRPFASAYGDDFRKSDFHPDQWFQNSRKVAENEKMNENVAEIYNNKKSLSKSNVYNGSSKVHPKSLYNGYVKSEIKNDPHSVDAIIGELDSYKNRISKKSNDMHSGSQNEMDFDYKIVMPNNRSSNKRECENNYRAVPFMQGDSIRDIDVDTYMRFGTTPSRGAKSLGYPNPAEHYFGYISNDIQDPNHVVMNRGLPSRELNKQEGKKKIDNF